MRRKLRLRGKLRIDHLTDVSRSILVAEYKVDLDEHMIIRAIKINAMDFLYCVWAYNKNFSRNIKSI